MAIINHYTRDSGGDYKITQSRYDSAAAFCVDKIPDGVPFRVYRDGVDVTKDIDAMLDDGSFTIIESAGELMTVLTVVSLVLGVATAFMMPKPGATANQQAESPNNSLTARSNKPRPYERVYDICGTVQTITSDLMQTYRIFDEQSREFEYGYYYAARGYIDTPASVITDGDTLLSEITGSSVNIYDPFTSPNNSEPRQIVGEKITEPLFISVRSNEVDGIELKAPNEAGVDLDGGCRLTYYDAPVKSAKVEYISEDVDFTESFTVGSTLVIRDCAWVKIVGNGATENVIIDGEYECLESANDYVIIKVIDSSKWINLDGSPIVNERTTTSPTPNISTKFSEYTDWFSITKLEMDRALINIIAPQGMYKDKGKGKVFTSVDVEIEWQQLSEQGEPIGDINTASGTLKAKTGDEVGVSIIIPMPVATRARFRARRITPKDYAYNGTVVDEIKLRDIYGQSQDSTAHYGDLTTVHSVRKRTARATSAKEPQLKMIVTEMVNKYLGNGVFDTNRTPNTQAAQSLIRLMRDPLVGGLSLTSKNMDDLLAVQQDIETYFGADEAGQFCYTFDKAEDTAQDIATTIAAAVFSTISREGNDIKLTFEKPQQYPAMLFTHRSKVGNEKWDRSFNTRESYDSVEYTYIDPDTNIKETIKIPSIGGAKPNKIDGIGVRNYKQAFWAANRARQKDKLRRISVEFEATEEGIYAKRGEMIEVVKGSRVGTYDGYIVAQNGLQLTLSQEVEFVDGDNHSLVLKRRDGTAESVSVEKTTINKRTVNMLSLPSEPIYTGNSALKTEFSFGNDSRHFAQMIIPASVEPSDNRTVKITGYNYDSGYYLYDNVPVFNGFEFDRNEFNNQEFA